MMKKTTILLLIFLTGCTKFMVDIRKDNHWLVKEKGNIVVYYRPSGTAEAPAPTTRQAEKIADNQNRYLQDLNDTLHLNFNEKVLVYLFNQSEAKELIGTDGGGHAVPDVNSFYFTFINLGFFDGVDTAYIGSHELVHVVTHKLLGLPGTRMMSEGYAVALSTGYGYTYDNDSGIIRKSIDRWMQQYYAEERILSPYGLLNQADLPERIFYPNAGSFVRYLINQYGTIRVNKLFPVEKNAFDKACKEFLNKDLSTIADDYRIYCNHRYGPQN
ncbi:MAG: hypothetical protein JXR71_09805 [Bacteroidales bacterium]|nr:hypothetical protein [Bacteroidales bacterium]